MSGGKRKAPFEWKGTVLAPMVRCGTLPLRVLCLEYGADAVWTEEIIDRRLSSCERVENAALGTVDFVTPDGNSIVLRTCRAIECGRLVCQLGTAGAETALAAARRVERDVDAIDINMGCPKKFSVQGGMGAALLRTPDVAEDIVRTLSSSLSIPVSAKIRLLSTMEETVALAKRLEAAGARALTVHMRSPKEKEQDAAHWDLLKPIVDALSIPVFANGDLYRVADVDRVRQLSGCAGVMLARPALRNASLFRAVALASPATSTLTSVTGGANATADASHGNGATTGSGGMEDKGMLPVNDVIIAYIRECIRWGIIYQNAKCAICSCPLRE